MLAEVSTTVLLAVAGSPAAAPVVTPPLRSWSGGTSGLTWTGSPDDAVVEHRPGFGAEGYELRVGHRLVIRASTSAGVFYARQTIRQVGTLPYGVARDRPRYPERALMIDDGRAFYPRAWLAARIRQLARLKLNELHLHFSDDQGFRIESKTHPEVVTQPALSQDDVRALVRVAKRNHVQLIPEIDMPGHMTAALRDHPELELRNAAGQRQAGKLDVSIPAAKTFALDLIDEYIDLFHPKIWHMGADEYLGVASTPADYAMYPQLKGGKDAVFAFVNAIGDHVRARGVQLRVWSDGAGGGSNVTLDPRTSVEWWDDLHSPAPADLIAAGHDVVNTGWWPLYYVTGGPLKDHRATEAQLREDWLPWQFDGEVTRRFGSPDLPPEHSLAPDNTKQRGASLAVWNDDPTSPDATPKAVARGIRPRLRILAQKLWSPRAG